MVFFKNFLKKKVHFLHIGKTGGTVVKSVLKNNLTTGKYSIQLHPHSVKFMDIPKGEKIIFFLREPVSRFISGFYSRQRKGLPRHNSPWTPEEETAFGLFKTPNELAMSLADKESINYEFAVNAFANIRHVNTQYYHWFKDSHYFQSRIDDILFIGYQETLNKDFQSLKQALELPSSAELPKDDYNAHRNPINLDKLMDEKAITALHEWYQEDYEFIELCQSKG